MLRQSTCNDEEKSQILNVQNSTTFRWIELSCILPKKINRWYYL